MKNLARAAATVGAVIGIAAFAAPAASAATTAPAAPAPQQQAPQQQAAPHHQAPQQQAAPHHQASPKSTPQHGKHHAKPQIDDITVYYVQGDALLAQENGPGDQANYLTKDSKHFTQPAQNEATKTGDIEAEAEGKYANAPVEVEGSEQSQYEAS